MEYSNEMLIEMNNKRIKNKQIEKYFYRWDNEFYEQDLLNDPFKDYEPSSMYWRGERIGSCLDLWTWDKYESVKILDLQRVNRCKNTRFCPNCKILENSKYLHKIKPEYERLLKEGYNFYFLTLTIPSINSLDPEDLKAAVIKLYKDFSKFKDCFVIDLKGSRSRHAYKDRLVQFAGGIRVLEITHNYINGFHPHIHCIIVTDKEIPSELLEPKYRAKFSTKRKSIDYKNELEYQIAKMWSLIYTDNFSVSNMNKYDYDPSKTYALINGVERTDIKNLEVNFRSLDEDGFKETFKYTVKSSEITSYEVFKCFHTALYGKRIRQGFGCLYHLKINDCIDDEGTYQELPSECDGLDPETLLVSDMSELWNTYCDYRKISRFSPSEEKEVFKLKD